ncbi:hypothetical protein ACFWUP_02100 [Nocardia sp. NPDC058658]|uniref:hypothetical protein n=1 Tax=Nocardia sp. NPDC058658 TaxID=3346580 RepID=UPI003654728C
MKRPNWTPPSTLEEALVIARELASNPDSLVLYRHHGLENARYGRGFAFLHTISTEDGETDGYVLVSTTAYGSGLLSMAGRTIDSEIAEHLARAEHSNRHIPDSELSTAHRVALEAYDSGRTRIDELPRRAALDAETADYAEFVLIHLRRSPNREATGRNILAHNDFLMERPVADRRYTQPCPHCKQPSIYQQRYPRAVCGHCHDRATDSAGRQVTGFNTHLSGGMIAYFADTVESPDGSPMEECVEVTQTGVCFIDGHPATMQEAHFGGIVVEMTVGDRGSRRWFRWGR